MSNLHFKIETGGDGIALVTRDSPGRSMNVIDMEVIAELGAIVDAVVADAAIKGVVISSGKETFCAGADVGSILGFWFAPFTGGTLSYIDTMGSKPFVELCRRLEGKHGARFKPAKLLHDMALGAETFDGRFAPGRRAA